MAVVWPFVGRGEELRLVRGALRDRAGLVLAGAAGTGKTVLMSRALAQLPARTRWVAATKDSAAIPFGAIAPLLPAGLPTATSPLGLLHSAAATMTAGLDGDRLVIGIDDAHLLDDFSAALVQHLVQTRAVGVALTVRTGEPMPDAVVALWKDDLLERVELRALTEPQVDEVLTAALNGQVETGTVRRLHRLSAGNPLLIRELVSAAANAGTLTEVAGVWRWQGAPVLAPRLVEVISGRLGRLEPDERDVLELVTFGGPLGVDLLAGQVSAAALDSVVAKELVWVAQDRRRTQVHLAHPLYSEVLRAKCPSLRANRWRRVLADAVESKGARRLGDWTRVAMWRLDAEVPCAPDVLLCAARETAAAMDFALAERFATAAGDDAADVLWRVVSLRDPARTPEMEAMLARALAREDLPEERCAQLAHSRGFLLFWFLDRTEDAIAALRSANPDHRHPDLTALESLFVLYRPDPRSALDLVRPLTSHPDLPPRTRGQVEVAHGISLMLLGRLSEARAVLDVGHATDPMAAAEVPGLDMAEEIFQITGLLLSGQIVDAVRAARALRERGQKHEWHWNTALLCMVEAQAWRFHGRIARADRILREGLSHYRSDPGSGAAFGGPLFAEMAIVAALAGNGNAAREALAEAERLFRPSQAILRFGLDLARPWVAFACGDRDRGIELAWEAAASARSMGAYAFEQLGLYDMVRLGAADRAVDRLSELTGVVDGELVGVLARACEATEDAATDLAALGADLLAAETAVRATRTHPRSALLAERLVARCDGAVVLGLADVDVPRLSDREKAVVDLAAAGMSSREIADRLVLSPRTVENHLHRVYTKLGVDGRAELRRWVSP